MDLCAARQAWSGEQTSDITFPYDLQLSVKQRSSITLCQMYITIELLNDDCQVRFSSFDVSVFKPRLTKEVSE